MNTYVKNELANLISILRTNYNGYPWHGDSAEKTLLAKSAKSLLERPAFYQRMIWRLTNEIIGWKAIMLKSLQGQDVDFNYEVQQMRYPHPKEFTAELWKDLIQEYKSVHADLIKRLETFHSKPAMREVVQQLNGKLLNLIMHEVYCMGQITTSLQAKKKHFD